MGKLWQNFLLLIYLSQQVLQYYLVFYKLRKASSSYKIHAHYGYDVISPKSLDETFLTYQFG